MDYKSILADIEESRYLISMTPAAQLVRLGHEAGMTRGASVLENCTTSLIRIQTA